MSYTPPTGHAVNFDLPSFASGPVVLKRPLALYAGRVKELQPGDSLYGFLKSWVVENGDYAMFDGDRVLADTSVAPLTVTLPAAPTPGQSVVSVKDYAGTFAANNCTIDNNGMKIDGVLATKVLSTNGQAVELTYSGSAQGWLTTTKV